MVICKKGGQATFFLVWFLGPTPPKANIYPLKNHGWKTIRSF